MRATTSRIAARINRARGSWRAFVGGRATVALAVLTMTGTAAPVALAQPLPDAATKAAAPVERLGPTLLRIGSVRVDTALKEVSVTGTVNDVSIIEFIATTKASQKSYESVLELDTNGVNFNVALILAGLDPSNGYVSIDVGPRPNPKGDPVELWVEWTAGGTAHRVRAEQLVWNERLKQTLSEGPWVYTGSVFLKDDNMYLADLQGILIGFIHTTAPVIESPRPFNRRDYSDFKINPKLDLKPGTPVTLTVKVLPRGK